MTGIVKQAQLSSWKLVLAAKQPAKEQYHILDLQWKQRLRVEEEEFEKRKLRDVLIFFLLIFIFFSCRVQ